MCTKRVDISWVYFKMTNEMAKFNSNNIHFDECSNFVWNFGWNLMLKFTWFPLSTTYTRNIQHQQRAKNIYNNIVYDREKFNYETLNCNWSYPIKLILQNVYIMPNSPALCALKINEQIRIWHQIIAKYLHKTSINCNGCIYLPYINIIV